MDTISLNEKARELCDAGACCSMGEARRAVMYGAFDKFMKKTQQKNNVENQDGTAPKSDQVSQPNNSAMIKLLERWLYPEMRGDILDLTHDTKVAIEQLRQ